MAEASKSGAAWRSALQGNSEPPAGREILLAARVGRRGNEEALLDRRAQPERPPEIAFSLPLAGFEEISI